MCVYVAMCMYLGACVMECICYACGCICVYGVFIMLTCDMCV